jgi:hypothetical protein
MVGDWDNASLLCTKTIMVMYISYVVYVETVLYATVLNSRHTKQTTMEQSGYPKLKNAQPAQNHISSHYKRNYSLVDLIKRPSQVK